jgi:hypothetical protein
VELFLVITWFLLLTSPLWLPLVFVAYAIGRRRFGILLLLVLVTVEAISISAILAVLKYTFPAQH